MTPKRLRALALLVCCALVITAPGQAAYAAVAAAARGAKAAVAAGNIGAASLSPLSSSNLALSFVHTPALLPAFSPTAAAFHSPAAAIPHPLVPARLSQPASGASQAVIGQSKQNARALNITPAAAPGVLNITPAATPGVSAFAPSERVANALGRAHVSDETPQRMRLSLPRAEQRTAGSSFNFVEILSLRNAALVAADASPAALKTGADFAAAPARSDLFAVAPSARWTAVGRGAAAQVRGFTLSHAAARRGFALNHADDGSDRVGTDADFAPAGEPASPEAPQALVVTTRGQFWRGVAAAFSAGVFAFAAFEIHAGAVLGLALPAYAAYGVVPALVAAGFGAAAAVSHGLTAKALLGAVLRVEKPRGEISDDVEPPGLLARLGSAWRGGAVAGTPVYAQLTPRARGVVDAYAAYRGRGLAALRTFLRVGAEHPRHLARALGALLLWTWRLPGRVVRGAVAFVKLVHLMARGDPEFRHLHKPYAKTMRLTNLLLVLDGVFGITMAFLMGPLLDTAKLAGETGLAAHLGTLGWISASIGVLFLLYMIVERKHVYLNRVLGLWAARDYRIHFMRKFQGLDLGFHGENGSGALANRLKDDTNYLSIKNVSVPLSLAHYTIYFVLGVALMFYTHWQLALVVLSVAPLIGWLNAMFGQWLQILHFDVANRKADLLRHNQEVLGQAATVKQFATLDVEDARYAAAADKIRRLGEREARIMADYNFVAKLGDFFTKQLIYIAGGWALAFALGMSFGAIVQMTMFSGFVAYAFHGLSAYFLMYKRYHGASEKIREMWARAPTIEDPEHPLTTAGLKGRVKFDAVSFAYDGNLDEPVLDGLTVEAEPGQTVAFVGETGSGKSTLARLLIRLWDPQKGRVTIDGRDIKDMERAKLMDLLAVVPQETRLYNDTIGYNMRYGSEDAAPERLARAIKMAKADFVYDAKRFPQGLDTPVSEGGGRLSGGERQRVAIVRALLREPTILILDEATSALDNESEKVVQAAIDQLIEGEHGAAAPTTFVIAHRLTTIMNADVIVVLEKGRVAEQGTHAQLLAKQGIYARLWRQGGTTKKEQAPEEPKASALGHLTSALAWGLGAAALGVGTYLLAAPLDPIWTLAAVVGAAALPGAIAAVFALTGARIAMAVRAQLKRAAAAADGESLENPAPLDKVLTTAVATPASESDAFASLPERDQDFIRVHETAHRAGAGEFGAYLRQAAGGLKQFGRELAAWARGLKNFGGMLRTFVMGDREAAPFLRRHRGKMIAVISLLLLDAALWNVGTHYLGSFIDYAKTAADAGTAGTLMRPMLEQTLLVGGIFLATLFVERAYMLLQGLIKARFVRDVRVALNRILLGRELSFHMNNESGAIATRISDDTEFFGEKHIDARLPLFNALVFFAVAAVMLVQTHALMAVLVFALIPLLGLTNGIFGEMSMRVYNVFSKRRAELGQAGQESLEQITVSKTFNREELETLRYGAKAEALAEIGEKDARISANAHMFASALSDFFTKHALYMIGAWTIALALGMTYGQIVAVTFYAGFIKASADTISQSWMKFRQTHGATEVIREWLREGGEDSPDAEAIGPIRGDIAFEGVDFKYDPADEDSGRILDGVDLKIEAGETVAFVGESGSGKSTILRLVQRLWAPQSGRVTVDGRDIAEVTRKSLNEQIAIVPQDTRLFDASLRYNMLYGTEGVSEEQLEAAIRAASAHFVYDARTFPDGLDTGVGEGGARLSGGQRQRVAIVRAILRNPKILLLDEATSALDKQTEREIQRTLDQLTSGAGELGRPTTLVVAHNLTTIMNADRIVVMDRGRIVEVGAHAELLANNGRYRRLWDASMRGGE